MTKSPQLSEDDRPEHVSSGVGLFENTCAIIRLHYMTNPFARREC